MKFVICALLFVVTACYGHTSIGLTADKAHPGKCVTHGFILAPGESAFIHHPCMKIYCQSADGWTDFLGCGVQMPPEGCSLGEVLHPKANYPECCERKIVCK